MDFLDSSSMERAPSSVGREAIVGYDREVVERYFAAVEAERRRLRAEISAARTRTARARAAIDARRVLASMLEGACEEVSAKRRQAELIVARFAALAPAVDRVAVDVAGSPEPPRSEGIDPSIRWRVTERPVPTVANDWTSAVSR